MTPTVALYPADTSGCGSYRMIWPAEVLAAAGYPVAVYPPGHPKRLQAAIDRHGRVAAVLPPDEDVLVFQRPMNRQVVEAMEILRSVGKRIVVELDDDLERVSPRNLAFQAVHPAASPGSNWQHLRRGLQAADAVVVSTPALTRYGAAGRPAVVVHNRVPARYLDLAHDPGPRALGWTGTVETHPDDLQVMGPAVPMTVRRLSLDGFHVVGPGDGVAAAVGLRSPDLVLPTGWVPTEDYAATLAATLTVAVAPLANTAFNAGKSWLKPIEAAAAGIPVVMSDVAEYRALAELGIGLVAPKPAKWLGILRLLLSNDDYRAELSVAGRARVRAAGLVIEDRADLWWEAWTGKL